MSLVTLTAAQIAHALVFAMFTGFYGYKMATPPPAARYGHFADGALTFWMMLHTLWYLLYLLLHGAIITLT